MADSRPKSHWAQTLRVSIGVALCALAVLDAFVGAAWYLSVGGAVIGAGVVLGRRRIFRPGVFRTSHEVVCRYIPWYEGNVYFLNVLLPLMGVALIAAGASPGNPVAIRFIGAAILALTPLFTYAAVRMWWRCFLRISTSRLTVRLGTIGAQVSEIGRDAVESIEPKAVENGGNGQLPQVEITYRPADLSSTTQTVLLGLSLTVEPTNLLNALLAWKAGTNDDPGKLLDRIEQILRGHSPTVE